MRFTDAEVLGDPAVQVERHVLGRERVAVGPAHVGLQVEAPRLQVLRRAPALGQVRLGDVVGVDLGQELQRVAEQVRRFDPGGQRRVGELLHGADEAQPVGARGRRHGPASREAQRGLRGRRGRRPASRGCAAPRADRGAPRVASESRSSAAGCGRPPSSASRRREPVLMPPTVRAGSPSSSNDFLRYPHSEIGLCIKSASGEAFTSTTPPPKISDRPAIWTDEPKSSRGLAVRRMSASADAHGGLRAMVSRGECCAMRAGGACAGVLLLTTALGAAPSPPRARRRPDQPAAARQDRRPARRDQPGGGGGRHRQPQRRRVRSRTCRWPSRW